MKRVLLALAASATFAVPALAESPAPAAPPASAAVALLSPALNVGNLDAELRFYVDGLGMTKLVQIGAPEHKETMLGFVGHPEQAGVMLLSDTTRPPQPPFAKGDGFNRLVMRVRDLPGVVARLRKLGYTASDVRNVAMGYRMATATDPEGYKLELVESGIK